MDLKHLESLIESAYESRDSLTSANASEELKLAIEQVLYHLEIGQLRVAQPVDGKWIVNAWLKKAVLLYFRIRSNQMLSDGVTQFFDKVPLRFSQFQSHEFEELKLRVVPPAYVRRGAYLGPSTVLMPSYVNIGAYVGANTMIDTWATVGSCAQIGSNVHISGGVGIGGVLEPLQASPTIIEDDCFIGARSEIVEGVVVERGSVISMGVFIGQSTKIYDRETKEVFYGRVPSGSVVVPGTLPSKDGSYALQCAIIVKKVDAKTLSKVGLNQLLRENIWD